MPRVFAGITTPLDLSRELKNWRRESLTEKWTHRSDFHLTLAFIGECEEPAIEELKVVLEAVAGRHSPFALTLDEFGAFPEPKDAHAFWAGPSRKCLEVLSLASDLRATLDERKIEYDPKPFLPHISLSRIKKGGDVRHRIKKFNRQVVEVNSLILFSTRPPDEVPRYEKLFETLLLNSQVSQTDGDEAEV